MYSNVKDPRGTPTFPGKTHMRRIHSVFLLWEMCKNIHIHTTCRSPISIPSSLLFKNDSEAWRSIRLKATVMNVAVFRQMKIDALAPRHDLISQACTHTQTHRHILNQKYVCVQKWCQYIKQMLRYLCCTNEAALPPNWQHCPPWPKALICRRDRSQEINSAG